MYVDAYAIIVQQDGDGGDSLQREGMYAFGQRLRYLKGDNTVIIDRSTQTEPTRDPAHILDQFEVRPGVYVRHPDPTQWYSNPDTTSRDQLVPVIAYSAVYEDYPRLWRLFKAVAKRGFFAQNTLRCGENHPERKIPDTFLGHLGLFIRAGGYWTAPLYPFLLVTDSLDLAGTILNLVPLEWDQSNFRFRWSGPQDVDDNNAIIGHLLAAHYKPTPIAWFNRQVYAWSRPYNFGNSVMGERNPVMGSLRWYHRREGGGNPEIAELYRPLIEEYLSPREEVDEALLRVAMFFDSIGTRSIASVK